MNIKNPEVHELARRTAEITGETMTKAIRIALEERLARLEREHEIDAVVQRVTEKILAAGPTPEGLTSDHDDLYDESGLPA